MRPEWIDARKGIHIMVQRRTVLKTVAGAAVASAVSLAAFTPQRAAASTTLTAWGVCGHPPMIDDTSYPAHGAPDDIALAAELGAGYYRVDFLLPTATPGPPTGAGTTRSWRHRTTTASD